MFCTSCDFFDWNQILRALLLRRIAGKPWLRPTIERDQNRFQQAVGVRMSYEAQQEMFLNFCVISIQHIFGGICAVPGVFGLADVATSSFLNRHGALCEVGYELGDLQWRLTERCGVVLCCDVIVLCCTVLCCAVLCCEPKQ